MRGERRTPGLEKRPLRGAGRDQRDQRAPRGRGGVWACALQENADAMTGFAKLPGTNIKQVLIDNTIAYREHPRSALNNQWRRHAVDSFLRNGAS